MLDGETVIRHPHSATVTRVKGKKKVVTHDPRISVAIAEGGATLTLFFPPETGWAGDANPLEIRIEPREGADPFEPWRLMPKLPLYLSYARASLAHRDQDIRSALQALRALGTSRRGLGDEFYRLVAQSYEAIVAEGEPYPVKALAEMQPVDVSTASRWIKEARRRGFLPAEKVPT
jgi:hypothetical protein